MKSNLESLCGLRLSASLSLSPNNALIGPPSAWPSLACGGDAFANAQTTNAPSVVPPTGSVTNKLAETTVSAKLDTARSEIQPDLGASKYTFTTNQIQNIPGGENAPFNEVLLRAPGVVQDSAVNGDLHVRGEHANLQYRINDVLLPEGLSGFGLEIDTRFVDTMSLITGSLPAQYGFRTAGVVDIQTKGGFENGGEASFYGGSYDTFRPGFEYGGSTSNINYFVSGSLEHTSLGLEIPTSSHDPVHDKSDQGKFFSYTSYLLDYTSRLSLMLSASDSNFQVPNAPGNTTPFVGTGVGVPPGLPASFNSANLNENQDEQNYFAALTYQKSAGNLNFQVSALARRSSVHFMPDDVGDLYFNGVASDVDKILNSGGLEADASVQIGENHTVRAGLEFIGESVSSDTSTMVYNTSPPNVHANGVPLAPAFPIVDNANNYGLSYGVYVQDEWKMFDQLTINYGARFDIFNSSFDNENQFSPRINFVYKPTDSTTLHAGYSHYFTPPAPEFVSGGTLAKFVGTSNDQGTQDSPIQSERADYFDVGAIQKIAPGLTVGVDGYYKHAHNQIDDGLFGQSLILSTFNYSVGQVDGVELTANYTKGGFSTYANLAIDDALGTGINSAQFLFDQFTLAYTDAGNYIHLDHHELVAGSFGTSYLWQQCDRASLQTFIDARYSSGLRTDLTDAMRQYHRPQWCDGAHILHPQCRRGGALQNRQGQISDRPPGCREPHRPQLRDSRRKPGGRR